MNPHLSVFWPYRRDASHEDDLTRAAMILLKLVPLAHDAFLRLAKCSGLAELPSARLDMQTGRLVAPDGQAEETEHVDELVSVFLAPHESVARGDVDVDSARQARYDGVIQYGPRLLV